VQCVNIARASFGLTKHDAVLRSGRVTTSEDKLRARYESSSGQEGKTLKFRTSQTSRFRKIRE